MRTVPRLRSPTVLLPLLITTNLLQGVVYVFTRNGSGIWTQDAYIKAANNDVDDNFGDVVSIDGDTIVAGADLEDSNQTTITNGTTSSTNNDNTSSGAVYVYKM